MEGVQNHQISGTRGFKRSFQQYHANSCRTSLCACGKQHSLETTNAMADYFKTDKRPVILYDGVCNMCNAGMNKVMQRDTAGIFRFAALQSTPGKKLLVRCGRAPDDLASIVLVEEAAHCTQSDAIISIYRRLPMPAPLIAGAISVLPQGLRDALYNQVAKNRYSIFGRSDTCRCEAGVQGQEDRFLGA